MELIEPRNFFFSFLLFFSGCFMNRSPEPIEITTPKSVISKKLIPGQDEIALLFQFDKEGNLFYNIIHDSGSTQVIKIKKDVRSIGDVIDKARLMSEKNSKPLNVMIKGDNNAKYDAFKTLIEALKSRGLFKFQLITDAE